MKSKAPVLPEPWSSDINATEDASLCIQKNYFFDNPEVTGDEDCLYLNVYVPKVKNRKKLLPVMVFIHWGGFFIGGGSSDIIGPEYIMDKDVILVTFNYRLGVFGFFTTLDDAAPGNFGLKDQVMALRFVHENIQYFGGAKHHVTIFGQNAGGASVDLHLISPLSRGLFQQAISQSGVALNLWAKPLNMLQSNVTAALARFVGCDNNLGNNADLVKCLRKIDAFTLTESGDKFEYFSVEPFTPFSIVTEQTTAANPNPFLTKEPLEYLRAEEFQNVPWIVGNVQDEGILRVAQFLHPETLQYLNRNFSTVLPQMLALQLSAGVNASNLLKNLTKFYLGGKTFINKDSRASVQGLIDLFTDRLFTYGTFQDVILKSRKLHKPIWLYNFNYKGQYTYSDLFAATDNKINLPRGVSHCDDLLYLFKSPLLFPELTRDTDLQMSENLLTFWTNFAIYGNPDPYQTVKWRNLVFSGIDEIK
ncbi:COesterase domain containing protein, partial [Asbolus verrucosus]